jgi:two-component system, cell cycle sensor histidine kinase and response regulator CckA
MQPQHSWIMDSPGKKSRRLRDKPGVLVVDGDHLVRSMLQLGLERDGYDVWLTPNGLEAVDLYREHKNEIAVVLLELCSPGMEGLQTLDALRELDLNVQVCLMSGNGGGFNLQEFRQRGAAFFIAKPFYLDELANILRLLAHGAPADLLSPSVPAPTESKSGDMF